MPLRDPMTPHPLSVIVARGMPESFTAIGTDPHSKSLTVIATGNTPIDRILRRGGQGCGQADGRSARHVRGGDSRDGAGQGTHEAGEERTGAAERRGRRRGAERCRRDRDDLRNPGGGEERRAARWEAVGMSEERDA